MPITVTFEQNEWAAARRFAKDSQQETYSRLPATPEEEVERIFVGKLGEVALAKFLKARGKKTVGNEDMFTVWTGATNVDAQDFLTADGKLIDVKSAHQHFHSRILVPADQFQNQPKDFYVGIRIHVDKKEAEIIGYAERADLLSNGVKDYGKGPAYAVNLKALRPIEELIEMMPDTV